MGYRPTWRGIPWVHEMDQAKLDGEKKALEERTKAIAAFRGTGGWPGRCRYGPSRRRPPRTPSSRRISGDAEARSAAVLATIKGKKQLVVSFATPLSEDGSRPPPEIDGFLASLRQESSIKRHFPLIEVTGLRQGTRRGKAGTDIGGV